MKYALVFLGGLFIGWGIDDASLRFLGTSFGQLAKAAEIPTTGPTRSMIDDMMAQEKFYENTFMRAGGKTHTKGWQPLKLDDEGRVICAP